tara:strand:- start:321 stop:2087 length:1767 start_codon:yes stop_codon:yes gene_type:complete
MTAIVGTVSWGIVPLGYNSSNLAGMSFDSRGNYIKSANDQLRYQVQYENANLSEGIEATTLGQVKNVIFKIEVSVDNINFTTLASIKKLRDIANRKYDNDTSPLLHRFTIDVSELVSDQLSYSLCPINKGTWQSHAYGGMNGGLVIQDNVVGNNSIDGTPVSLYNVSENGTFRYLKVSATFGVLNSEGQTVVALTSSGLPKTLNNAPIITVINSVNQFETDSTYYEGEFMTNASSPTSNNPKRFLTRCPNWYYNDSPNNVAYNKLVRMDEQAEFLQWYTYVLFDSSNDSEFYNYAEIFGQTFLNNGAVENTFVLADFNSLLNDRNSTEFEHSQLKMLQQNVSPDFINNNAFAPQITARPYSTPISPITANTHRYALHFKGTYFDDATSAFVRKIHSATNWFQIDREDENIPYAYVRFHWLNSMGGIDSYTAKRDVVEGLTISRDVVERKSSDRTWYQANSGAVSGSESNVSNSSYISDTMRGGDIYKGGREVSSVNADRVKSVYTEPLNQSVAKWLEELILSPNVWVEMETDATARGFKTNPYLRPSVKEYIPVIITNSDIESVNQENGLVRFNIEYTLAHKVQTQSN